MEASALKQVFALLQVGSLFHNMRRLLTLN